MISKLGKEEDIDHGTEWTLSKLLDDTKLCGVADMLEGRDAIQQDLDKLGRWAHANLMKFNKAKCKILHVGWSNPKHKYRLGREWIESSLEEKDLGMLVGGKFIMTQQYALGSPESQLHSGLHQKKHGQQVERGDSAPLLCSGETPPGELCPALEPPTEEGHGPVGVSTEESHEEDQRAGAPLL
ncbi:rna-directed dna polymerase from mobile element jockey-like [Limosa lapponica baueri]|uniref:Rna-directed dna polymerase from mobile element jockey-like n=1 Tax=Limosa lapponica baueri TaxID=1758121 RepID=A0A2I0UN52_LIMLA|nr:rna-directed dna polymerase from mobile element jockey-like [Limosa lapponica baueri]